MKIPSVYKLVGVLLTCRIAFSCVDSATSLKLQEKGFPKETAGLLVFIYVPFELVFPFVIAGINKRLKMTKMQLWKNGFRLRIIISVFVASLVYLFELDDKGRVPFSFILRQLFTAILYLHGKIY